MFYKVSLWSKKWLKDYHSWEKNRFVEGKESLYIGEPIRQQKNLVMSGYRVEFD